MTAIKSLLNRTGSVLKMGFKVFRFAFKTTRMMVFTLILVVSIALNFTMLFWQTGALTIAGLMGTGSFLTTLAKNNSFATNKAAIQKKTKNISQKVARGAKRKIALVPAKFVPFAGAFVVIAATGYELRESCAIMQDMKDISNLLDLEEDNITADASEVCGFEVPKFREAWAEAQDSPADSYNVVEDFDIEVPDWEDVKDGEEAYEESQKSWWNFWGS